MRVYMSRYPGKRAKKKTEQTIRVKIDKHDTWNMDSTLAHIIVPMLKQLKETKHGAPFTDDEDVPDELKSTAASPKENEWDVDEYHFKRWDWIMDEMIWAFEQKLLDDCDSQFYSGEMDILWADKGDGFSEMTEGPNNTFKVDQEGLDNHHERMKSGYRLFGKYLQSLWD